MSALMAGLTRVRLVVLCLASMFPRCAPEPVALVLALYASAASASSRYTASAVETATAGFSSPSNDGGQPPYAAFFSSVMPSRALYGRALAGSLRARRCHRSGLLTRLVPAHPFSSGRRASHPTMEAAMPKALARPEQTHAHIGQTQQSPLPANVLAIVRHALRGAIASRSDREGMDLACAALVQLAELARAEVRHA